jgi:arsenate reductase-like glutaredoxin family protein
VNQGKIPRDNLIPDQVSAAIVGELNSQRIRNEAIKLVAQDEALFKAVDQLEKVREFVANPNGILGNPLTKHGEIAEQLEVGIRNAKSVLNHQEMVATFDGIGRTAPADYSIDGTFVQSKFINGINNNLNHVLDHMDDYKNFGRDGSFYHIPKDTYETVINIKNGVSVDELSEKTKAAVLKRIQEIEQQSGKSFEAVVQPSSSTYSEVQTGKISETIDKHEQELEKENEKLKDKIVDEHKPSLQGAAQAAVIAGTVGGAISLGTSIYGKYKEGKNPFKGEFSESDWKEVGITTAKGTAGGAITGAAVYSLTNYASLSAPFAGAMVSAAKGVASLVDDYNKGKITFEEFTDLGLIVCAESAIVGLATAVGQTLIPIPILGSVIGSVAGKMLAEFTTGKSQELCERMRKDMDDFMLKVDANYQSIIKSIDKEVDRLGKLTEAAFDLKCNENLIFASANLARVYGVNEKDIIKNIDELDDFMLG